MREKKTVPERWRERHGWTEIETSQTQSERTKCLFLFFEDVENVVVLDMGLNGPKF